MALTELRNKQNTWFEKRNHVRPAKNQVSKMFIDPALGTSGGPGIPPEPVTLLGQWLADDQYMTLEAGSDGDRIQTWQSVDGVQTFTANTSGDSRLAWDGSNAISDENAYNISDNFQYDFTGTIDRPLTWFYAGVYQGLSGSFGRLSHIPRPQITSTGVVDVQSGAYVRQNGVQTTNISQWVNGGAVGSYQIIEIRDRDDSSDNKFGYGAGYAFWEWDEILVFDGDLTQEEAEQVHAYLAAKWLVSPTNQPIPPTTLQGPFPMSGGGFFWINPAGNIGFNTDQDPEPDIFATPSVVVNEPSLSDESKVAIHAALINLGFPGLPNFTPPPLNL